jgi:hypothetical protein
VELVANADGGFDAFWNAANAAAGNVVDYMGQRFDAAGHAVGGAFLVAGAQLDDANFHAVRLANGNVVVQWQGTNGAPMFRVVDPNGAAVTGTITVNPLVQSSDSFAKQAAVAASPDGSFVIAWNAHGSGPFDPVYFQRFDASGNAAGGPFLAINAQTDSGAPAIAVLADGNVVVSVEHGGSFAGQHEIIAGEFTAAGHIASGGTQIQLGGWALGDHEITAVADGGFAISYTVQTPGSSDGKIIVNRYDSGFHPAVDRPASVLGDMGTGATHSATPTRDGGIEFAWDYLGSGNPGDGSDIHTNGYDNVTVPGSTIAGTGASDTLVGTSGDDRIDGGSGIDTLYYPATSDHYNISRTAAGVTVNGFDTVGYMASDSLTNVERLHFPDINVALDVDGHAGQAYRLYQAAFDRGPDLAGLGYHINDLDRGVSLEVVAQHFLESPEFQAHYGTLDDTGFVTQLYKNILHRSPDSDGLAFHMHDLQNGVPRYDVLIHFSESPENQARLVGVIENGMDYTS